MRASRLRSGPTREGDGGDDGEEEQHAGQRPAAGADGEAQVAEEEGEHLTLPLRGGWRAASLSAGIRRRVETKRSIRPPATPLRFAESTLPARGSA